ncbi:MAG: aminotransferase class V-fold PLP-dependent enzyme [Daejeonella sp.]|uniref:aminotransferase class V-fold PLP-dependent enzyme n=1 Tax=Daejeonella sp. JGW-45 TaxID=3034148 RepID=UPI0023EC9EB1|nr:aminotransferase class V-fold PLP-dependent enzyme [Daejeonella sp. JGW-45]
MKRRDLIKYLSVAPLAGAAVGTGIPGIAEAAAAAPALAKRDVIKELGLRTFINAAGTYTTMTASLMHDEVVDTINESAKHFVMINEVQDKVGEKIAAMCKAEAAMVTAGCWSALVLGTAGVLTRMDRKKVALLPDLSTFEKTEVIVQKTHNVGYVHALTNTGIKPVEIETAEELEKAINSKTAMMWFLNSSGPLGKIKHEEWVAIGKKHNIPTMIDMAADVPPVENLWKYNQIGFDLVCVSGGKAMAGPQSAGILMGRKDLIAAARLSAPPSGGNIGRGMKVNKEEILGMYVAIEKYINQDHDKEWKMWEDRVALITNSAKKVDGVSTKVEVPPVANHTPKITVSWDQTKVKATPREIQKRLQDGSPSIETMGGRDGIDITVFMLKPGEEKIVARRLQEELTKAAVS